MMTARCMAVPPSQRSSAVREESRMRPTRRASARRTAVVCLGIVGALTILTPARGATIVLKDSDVGCFTDPGDIPGMPGFALPEATLVLRGNGGITLACHGWLPEGASMDRTFAGPAPCFTPEGDVVTAHAVATKSGRVHFICHFPTGTL
jgi:hypothetical protein